MAENFNLIFGSQAPTTASWSDADYQTGWNVVGSTPPTAEQFDALQNRSDKKSQELNNRLSPLEQKAQEQGRQAGTAYKVGAAVTVDGLPADWLLVCTTAGTSGTAAITLPNPLIDGATITDGTITWKLRKVATNGGLGYRQPSTAYAVGAIAYHSALPTGYYLECTTAGITSAGDITPSSTIGGTVSDGTLTWTVCKDIGTSNAPIYAGFNQKQTFGSSGSFTAPVTGMYKITLQGGGGGGGYAGADNTNHYFTGGGGGGGAIVCGYETLIAGTSYNFRVGAGGAAAASATVDAGSGGKTTITVNGNAYSAGGGLTPWQAKDASPGGQGGEGKVNGNLVSLGAPGSSGKAVSNGLTCGGNGGGFGGGQSGPIFSLNGAMGGGGAGGGYTSYSTPNYRKGGNGGNGYITFEWLDPTLL